LKKIDAPRDEIRETVIAALHKQSDEETRRKRRFCELAGLPYNPREEIQTQVFSSFLIEPYVNNLTGLISEEELLAQLKDIFKEYIISQIKKEEKSPEGVEQISQGVMARVDSLLAYIIPANYQERGELYWKYVFELAKEKGIAPKDVFASDGLYKEVLRNIYTCEENQVNIEKASSFLNPDTLLDIILKPIIRVLAGEDEEETTRFYNEFKKEMLSDLEFQKKTEALKNAFSQVVEEEMQRIYG